MNNLLYSLLRCPVTQSELSLTEISRSVKTLNGVGEEFINEGILFSQEDWFYPIIGGIPRLIVESFIDYEEFFKKHLPDYYSRRKVLLEKHESFIHSILTKNKRTKKSFSLEWEIFDYEKDNTWNAKNEDLLQRFLIETNESRESLRNKIILDAGCGNGILNQLIAQHGAIVVGMDFSMSIEKASEFNREKFALFIQADVQFPPFIIEKFDIVHASGVLIHTNNTELSFSRLFNFVRPGGKLSVWLYAPRKDFIHNSLNFIRRFTSKLPIRVQYYFYLFTLFPVSFIIKRLKGNKQNRREIMLAIMDWFSPEFRWEHESEEAETWFKRKEFNSITVTTRDIFGYNIIGIKNNNPLLKN